MDKSKLNRYEFEIKETLTSSYVIEAKTKKEAEILFAKWVEDNPELICHDLNNGSNGWYFSKPTLIERPAFVDVTYEELQEVLNE